MHRYGDKSTLWNVAIKVSPLLSHIFICTCSFCFAVTWCPSETSICLYVSYKKPGIKTETSGIIWHFYPESKIQLVNWKLSPKCLLGNLSLSDIHAIYAYIFWSLLFCQFSGYFSDAWSPLSLKCTCFRRFSFYLGGFIHFAIRWSSDPNLKHLGGVHSIRLFSESPASQDFSLSFLIFWIFFCIMVGTSTKSALFLDKICSLTIFTATLDSVKT